MHMHVQICAAYMRDCKLVLIIYVYLIIVNSMILHTALISKYNIIIIHPRFLGINEIIEIILV